MVSYPPLTNKDTEELVAKLMEKHPRVTNFVAPAESGPAEAKDTISKLSSVSDTLASFTCQPPSQDQIDDYNKKYDGWLKDLTEFLEATPKGIRTGRPNVDLTLTIRNDGFELAYGVRLSIETSTSFYLSEKRVSRSEDDDQSNVHSKLVGFRPPPVAPKPTRVAKMQSRQFDLGSEQAIGGVLTGLSGLSLGDESIRRLLKDSDLGLVGARTSVLASDLISRATGGLSGSAIARLTDLDVQSHFLTPDPPVRSVSRDRHAFYWVDRPMRSDANRWEFECEEFQHRMEPETFRIRLTAGRQGDVPRRGTMRVRLFSRNMRQPLDRTWAIHLEVVEADTRALIDALLPN